MKKRMTSLILVVVLVLGLAVPAAAANIRTVNAEIFYRNIRITINDVLIAPCDEKGDSTEPFIMNDTTYLPVRAIANALGLKVGWEPSTSTVVLERGGEKNYGSGLPSDYSTNKHVTLTYRGTNISLDGENVPLINRNGESVEPFIYNGTNYLPLRVVSEALGLNVAWNGANSTITLTGSLNEEEAEKVDPNAEKHLVPLETKYSVGFTGFPSTFENIMSINYAYNPAGRLVKLSSTDGSRSLKCNYDKYGRLESAVVNQPGITTTHKLVYKDDGELAAIYMDGALQQGYYCETDALGRIVREDKFSESGTPVYMKYSYDEQGRVKTEEFMDPGYYVTKHYSYDDQNRVARMEEHVAHYSSYSYTLYSYDEGGRLLSEKTYRSDDDYLTGYTGYIYDESGNLIRKEYANVGSYNENKVQGGYYILSEYSYNPDGSIKETATENGNFYRKTEGEGFELAAEIKERFRNILDENGRETYSCQSKYDTYYDWLTKIEYVRSYNSAGLLEQETRTEKTEALEREVQGTFTKSVSSYEYNAAGQMTVSEAKGYRHDELTDTDKSEWEYNEEGQLLMYRTSHNGQMTYEELYGYDNRGEILSFSNRNSMGPIKTETYEYDENGLLMRSEIANPTEGTSVVMEMEYVSVVKTQQNPYLEVLINQFTA